MKNILKTLIACILTSTLGTCMLAGIEKINDGLYVGKKGDIYFVLERVTNENANFWKKYADNQLKLAETEKEEAEVTYESELEKYSSLLLKRKEEYQTRKEEYNPEGEKELNKLKNNYQKTQDQTTKEKYLLLSKQLEDDYKKIETFIEPDTKKMDTAFTAYQRWDDTLQAIEPFIEIITKFYKNNDVWIAYATPQKITLDAQKIPLKKTGDIKMAFTVSTNKNITFSTHMGIFRAVDDLNFKNKTVSSMNLHSFASQAIQAAYDNKKEYMVTKPLIFMQQIMTKNLSKDALWENSKKRTITITDDEIIITKRSANKETYKKPNFFKMSSLETNLPLVIIDIEALANFMKLD